MASYLSNYFPYKLLSLITGKTFKAVLMASGFTFNRATHKLYADISGSELPTAYGYTAGGIVLSGAAAAQDDVNMKGTLTFNNVTFIPSGGNVTFCGAILYNSTDNIVCGFADAGGNVTAIDGVGYVISNLIMSIGTTPCS